MESSSTALVCSSDVAAFVDALETLNCNETVGPYEENIVICISEQDGNEVPSSAIVQETDTNVTDIEDACADAGSQFFNPDTRKLKAIMQKLVSQKKAYIVKKCSIQNSKGNKQFKSDVWNWFGDVRLFISENDAERLKIPYYVRLNGDEQQMICKVFVGCFRCSAIFMYDSQHHSTSTLRYHVRACTRPKECIFISDEKDEENQRALDNKTIIVSQDGTTAKIKRFRTDPRKQKEVIEQLFQKQKAIITRKSFMNMKGNRRFKSDVWNKFGDIRLLISRSEAKKLKIPYYIRRCGDEQMVLSKVFVGCFKCLALFIHDSQKSTSTLRYHSRTCSRPKERKKRTTPNIIFFPNKKSAKQPTTFNESDAIPAHEKLLNCALSTESSLNLIQEPEFHKILQSCIEIGSIYGDVNIDSLLCATPTLTSFILNDLYVSSVNDFYFELHQAYGATYKLSVWIDEQMKFPFISVYCFYVDSKGKFKKVIIHTDDFDYDRKTPECVRKWFDMFIEDQPVVPFKHLVLIDNDSHLTSVFKEDQCVVKCCVQNLTRCLQQTACKGVAMTDSELPDFTNLLSCCIELVNYFEQISDQYQLPGELIKCENEKWTSILAMFQSIEDQYENILAVLNETGSTHLLSVEKTTIKSIVKFLNIFEEAILQLSSNSNVTLNLVVPWIAKLQKYCCVESSDSSAVKQLKSHVLLGMNELVISNLILEHHIAAMLDPRFKSMNFGFILQYKDAHVKLKCLTKECMEAPTDDDSGNSRRVYSESDQLSSEKLSDPNKCEKAALQEVEKYLSDPFQLLSPTEEDHFDVLKFWSLQRETYPNLCKIAHWILACPASCLEDNRTYLCNDWLVNFPRIPLPADNVNKVLFVKSFRGL